jgi:2-phosphosulfolactate phosphatase
VSVHSRWGSSVRLEVGRREAAEIAPGCDVAVVVDVLSFTTTLTVAADRGVPVAPCPWRDDRARELTRRHRATLAAGRAQADPGEVSLSPGTVRRADELRRLVLPSPNGSTISADLAGMVPTALGASLCNRAAVAAWLDARGAERGELTVAVVAAGERWPAGELRPAVEDLWGAGGVVAGLGAWAELSPEAEAAAVAFGVLGEEVATALHRTASGRELDALGHGEDVDIAAEIDRSAAVPVMVGEFFEPG